MENSFCGMEKEDCLKRYFSGDYRLMLKVLFSLRLHICKDGIIKKLGER